MVNTVSLLTRLRENGVQLEAEGDQLRYRAPRGVLTRALLADLLQQKQEILELLHREFPEPPTTEFPNTEFPTAEFPNTKFPNTEFPNTEPSATESSTTESSTTESPNTEPSTTESATTESPNSAAVSASDSMSRLVRGPRKPSPSTNSTLLDHPFAALVKPVKTELWERVGLLKRFVSASGCHLFDESGQSYFDAIAQYGAVPFGHHPHEIWEAVDDLRRKSRPCLATGSLLDDAGELARQLVEAAGHNLNHTVFCNSGAEATEVAIKLSRAATGRRDILSTRGGFHGLTLGALSVTENEEFRNGFHIERDGVQPVPYGDLAALRKTLEQHPRRFAALIVEPIQGEAGIIEAPAYYLRDAAALCRAHGTLIAVDEVQTGLGRTGQMFAFHGQDVEPDILTVAKALGGGLVPIGAVLAHERAYSRQFGLRHSSTFAGNALACRVGIASLELLQRNDQALIHEVSDNGAYLKRRLLALRNRYPDTVQTVTGRGYMLGLRLNLRRFHESAGLFGILAEQQLLIHLLTSYLLNTEHVRLSPSLTGHDVFRIEPPLTATRNDCDLLAEAMGRALDVLDSEDLVPLISTMLGVTLKSNGRKRAESRVATARQINVRPKSDPPEQAARFGFVVHLSDIRDLARFDSALDGFDDTQLRRLKSKLADYVDPFPIGEATVVTAQGVALHGDFVLIPYTPQELVEMPMDEARTLIQQAVEATAHDETKAIGLGGFSSILSHGGATLDGQHLPPITSGNAYTVSATGQAVVQAMHRLRRNLLTSTLAVVGASGQIGQAVALRLASSVGRLVLIGNDRDPQGTERRLRIVAQSIVSHLLAKDALIDNLENRPTQRADQGLAGKTCQLARRFGQQNDEAIVSELVRSGHLQFSSGMAGQLRMADVIVTATSDIVGFIKAAHLGRGAVVCDVSRPSNLDPAVSRRRKDVTVIQGGHVRVPGQPNFDVFAGVGDDVTLACVAETMLWAASDRRPPDPVLGITPQTVTELERLGQQHGFEIVLPD